MVKIINFFVGLGVLVEIVLNFGGCRRGFERFVCSGGMGTIWS